MKLSAFFWGVLVVALSAVGLATASVTGDFEDKVVAALKARDVPAHEINEIVNLVPRDTVTITILTTPVDCATYGPPVVLSSYGVITETTQSTTTTSATSIATVTPLATPENTPESVPDTTAETTTTSIVNTETPFETPDVPVTPPVATTPVLSTTSVESSTVPTSEATTPFETTSSSSIVETTSSTTTHVTVSTTTSSRTTVTPSTSTGIPLAPNAASTAGMNVGLLGLVAVLALA